MCFAPQYVAETLLRSEGFTDIAYLKKASPMDSYRALASGEADVTFAFGVPLVARIDAGDRIVFLAGGHIGCQQLFANDRVHAIRDLKGKRIPMSDVGGGDYLFISTMISYVGLNPHKDVTWISHGGSEVESMQIFVEGKADACVLSAPFPEELIARKIGHAVVNTSVDRPWSQYFCCMIAGNRDFVRANPIATKRALRAILKGAEVCAREPQRVARSLVDKGFAKEYEYVAQAIKDIPYSKWREYDPEDTVRFYALRLHEAGLIKSSPQKIIAQGTDWRFLNELKRELKG